MNTLAKQKRKHMLSRLLKTGIGICVFLTVFLGFNGFSKNQIAPENSQDIAKTIQTNGRTNSLTEESQRVWDVTFTFQKGTAQATGDDLKPWDTESAKKGVDVDFVQLLQSVLKVAYMGLWPFLWIAGIAMDNSLVYGEVFGLDKALWQFWQIARNFANFIIWFIFLRQVLKYIFDIKSGKSDTTNVTKIITKLLLSSVGVQMSWFIMGALVDLSIVMTAGLWWLPLNIVDQTVASRPVFGIKTSLKLNTKVAENDNLVMLYTREWSALWGKYLLPCLIKDNQIKWGDNLKSAYKLEEKEWAGWGWWAVDNRKVLPLNVKREDINPSYCIYWQDVIAEGVAGDGTSLIAGSESLQNIIIQSRQNFVGNMACKDVAINSKGYDPEVIHFKDSPCTFLWNLARKGMWKQWSFFSLYASMLGLSSIHLDAPQTTATLTIETLLKIVIMIGFIVPLIALVVVLIMRVAYLWVIIAFSPLIALGIAWDILPKDNALTKKFTLTSIISLILLPVVVTFALSLSVIMLSSLSEWFARNWSLQTVGLRSKVIDGASCYDVWITNLCISSKTLNFWAGITDYFGWIIMNIFWIALMRFVVMASLKTNDITKGAVSSIEWMAKGFVGWLKFIPMPGGGYTNLWGITWAVQNITSKITGAPTQQVANTSNILDWMINNALWKDSALEGEISTATQNASKSGPSMTQGDMKWLQNIITNDNLFKDLNENASQIAGLTGYFNALNAKMGSTKKFSSANEVFDMNNAEWTKFLTNIAKYGNALLWEWKGDQILTNIKFLYKTNGETDKDFDEYIDGIKTSKSTKATYNLWDDGIKKTVTINNKKVNVDMTKIDLDWFVEKYNDYVDKIKEETEAKKIAEIEKELTDWIKNNFGDADRSKFENAIKKTKVVELWKEISVVQDDKTKKLTIEELLENTSSTTTRSTWWWNTTSQTNNSTWSGANTNGTQTTGNPTTPPPAGTNPPTTPTTPPPTIPPTPPTSNP